MSRPLRFAEITGVTLVEALFALGVLAWLLLSVVGLLAVGNRQVVGAGHRSQALAVAEAMLARLQTGDFSRVVGRFHCDTGQAECEEAQALSQLDGWGELGLTRTAGATVVVRLTAIGAPSLRDALAIRLSIRVEWREGPRARRLLLTGLRV